MRDLIGALILLGASLALPGCFKESDQCKTTAECFVGEVCTSTGRCVPASDMGAVDMRRADMSETGEDMSGEDMPVMMRRRTTCPAAATAACAGGACCVMPPEDGPIEGVGSVEHLRAVVDSEDRVHLLYYAQEALQHAWWNGTSWHRTTLASGELPGTRVFTRDDYDARLDSEDRLHVVFHDPATRSPTYRVFTTEWGVAEQVEDCSAVQGCGMHNALVLDAQERVHLVYQTKEGANTRYTHAVRKEDRWAVTPNIYIDDGYLDLLEAYFDEDRIYLLARRFGMTAGMRNTTLSVITELDQTPLGSSVPTWPPRSSEGQLALAHHDGAAWVVFRDPEQSNLQTVRFDRKALIGIDQEQASIPSSDGAVAPHLFTTDAEGLPRVFSVYLKRPDGAGEMSPEFAKRSTVRDQVWATGSLDAQFPNTGALFGVGMNDISLARVLRADADGRLVYQHALLQ